MINGLEAFGGWARRAVLILVGMAAGAGVGSWLLSTELHRLATIPAMVAGAAAGGVCAWVVNRASEWSPSGEGGMASGAELRRTLSARAARRSAKVTRPSIGQPKRAAVTEFGIRIGRSLGSRVPLYATMRDVILAVAPPQTGKTAWASGAVIDAPGPCVATSTRADIYRHTAPLRARRGPLYVLNPEGLGGVPSTFRWSPISGCHNPAVAIDRAGYLLAGSPATAGIKDRNFWEGSAHKLLRCLLYAAAVGRLTMEDLAGWVGNPDDDEPLRILRRYQATPPGWARDLAQVLKAPDDTRESVYLTLSLTFEFMAEPALAEACMPESEEAGFNVARFIKRRGTLYLLGSDRRHGSLSALFSALTGHLFTEAKRLASQRPNERLDPPLLLALDEAALICPVPLDRWTSDAGGRGIPILMAVQSPSQLKDRWGEHGGETIWSNSNVKLVFGGLTVDSHLQELSNLCGERDERVRSHSTGSNGERTTSTNLRRVKVMPPEKIRTLGEMQALVVHRTTRPTVAKLTPVWDRPDVRQQRRTAGRPEKERAARMPATAPRQRGPQRTPRPTEQARRQAGLAPAIALRQVTGEEPVTAAKAGPA